jgi:hypothetical protein
MLSYEDIYNMIKKYSPNNAEITNKTYSSRVHILIKANVDIYNYNETSSYILSKYTKKSYKSMMTSLVVFLKASEKLELAKKYYEYMMLAGEEIQKKEKDNEKSKSEDDNMVTSSEIKKLIENIKSQLSPEENTYKYFDTFKRYLVINLYYLIPPVRNDYIGCEVHNTTPDTQNMTKNYIILDINILILNRYKTRSTYGTGNIIHLPIELVDIIKKWMEIRIKVYPELVGNSELLLTKDLQPMGQVNLTQFLNRIFQKKVSSTILRKSYLSEKYPVSHTINEMQKDASAMQHSIAVQQSTYRKKN